MEEPMIERDIPPRRFSEEERDEPKNTRPGCWQISGFALALALYRQQVKERETK